MTDKKELTSEQIKDGLTIVFIGYGGSILFDIVQYGQQALAHSSTTLVAMLGFFIAFYTVGKNKVIKMLLWAISIGVIFIVCRQYIVLNFLTLFFWFSGSYWALSTSAMKKLLKVDQKQITKEQ